MEQSSDLNAAEQVTMSEQGTAYLYTSELFPPVMHVMAGFRRKDVYHVPRTEIKPPNEWAGISESSCRTSGKRDEHVTGKAIEGKKDG